MRTNNAFQRLVLVGCTVLLAAASLPAFAADEDTIEPGKWYSRVEAGLNLTQSAFSENWKSGGNSSLAWTAFFEGGLQRKYDNDLHWINSLQLRFGQTHTKRENDDGSLSWSKPEKTEDKIDFETLLLLEKGSALTKKRIWMLKTWGIDEVDVEGTPQSDSQNVFEAELETKGSLENELKKKFADVIDDPVMEEIMKAAGRQLQKNLGNPGKENERT